MTEAVVDGGVPAPAEPVVAPIEAPVDIPQPLGSQTPVAEKPEPPVDDKPKTAGEAIRKAMETVKAKEAAKAAEKARAEADAKDAPKETDKDKDAAKPAAERSPDGKFAAKAQAPAQQPEGQQTPPSAQQQVTPPQPGTIHEPPPRFDAAAKAEWANAPESVKGAVHRAFRELEAGIEEHRARWEPIKEYDDLAKQNQTTLPDALKRYVAFDRHLSEDLLGGLDGIIRDKTGGQYGLRDIAAHVSGQAPQQAQSQSDATIYALNQKIAQLEHQLGGVAQTIHTQTARSIDQQVTQFASTHEHFEALAPRIAEHIRAGQDLERAYQTALDEAQDMARSLGFAPAKASPAQGQPLTPAPTPAPLNPAGQKSVSGAPATGSDPASTRKAPVPSIREALQRARARVG